MCLYVRFYWFNLDLYNKKIGKLRLEKKDRKSSSSSTVRQFCVRSHGDRDHSWSVCSKPGSSVNSSTKLRHGEYCITARTTGHGQPNNVAFNLKHTRTPLRPDEYLKPVQKLEIISNPKRWRFAIALLLQHSLKNITTIQSGHHL